MALISLSLCLLLCPIRFHHFFLHSHRWSQLFTVQILSNHNPRILCSLVRMDEPMAFSVGEASSSFPASTSIPQPRSWTYHVFLSFRGEDTRKGFTDHLYAALTTKGIITFRDDKNLERGEVISVELLKAIEESMFAITVISPNYASSAWCLDELHKIVECKSKLGLFVVPVFYGVEPFHVRYQKGSFEESFKKHEQRFGQDSERVKRWRDALTQVASYSGWDSKNEHGATLVESIAQLIHKKLIPKLPSCDNLVGIDSRVEKVIRLIGIGLNDVRVVGIWGMGGIGKTTIARAVYDAIQGEFKISCFLANVKEVSETKGLVKIQKELVDHTNISTSTFHNLYDGKKIIRSSFCNKKVLLVLDDISDVSQLENLVGKQDWFGPRSKIIITTRDMHLLKIHGVHGTYEVEELVQKEALCLFCLKSFRQDDPKEGYLALSNEVVKYCGGLPLALEVLGSYLCGRTVDVWHSALKKIKSVSHSKILDTLKISYEGLDPTEKDIFLDVACFFKGMDRDFVTDILENCGHNPQIAIDVLIERSLITLQDGDVLDMHDLLQEMGKIIVIEKSPDNPGQRSRLWSFDDINLVLTEDKGTKAIKSLALTTHEVFQGTKANQVLVFTSGHPLYKAHWSFKAFSKTSQLKFLRLYGVQLPFGLDCLPSSLKVLHWRGCTLKTLPLGDQHSEIVKIKLLSSRIEQPWHGKKFLKKLKYLDLSGCRELKQTPDLSAVPCLETLNLSGCTGLTKVHPSLIHHKSIVLLDFSHCNRLKTLPGKLEMSSLKELILARCKSFENLAEFGECMKNLSRLSLLGTAITELPISLGCLVGLEYLNLGGCKNLVGLPDTIHELNSLKILWVNLCTSLCRLPPSVSRLSFLSYLNLTECCLSEESFPEDFCDFPLLMELILDGNNFVSVPISIHKLPKLRLLKLNSCQNLRFLPELPPSIRKVEACNCGSLNTSKFNHLSKACSVFASHIQDRGQVLQMGISGKEIPSWFVHQQKGNRVLVPLSHNFPLNQRLGIALCFLLQASESGFYIFDTMGCHLAICNGDRIIKDRIFTEIGPGYLLFMVCLTNDHFSGEFHHDTCFELSIEDKGVKDDLEILSSAARWICIEDIEDLNNSEELETKRPQKRKRKQEEADLIESKRKREEEDLIDSFAQMQIM